MWLLQSRSRIRFDLTHDSSWRTSNSWRRPLCCCRRIAAAFLRPWSSVDWLLCSRFPQVRCPSRSWGFVPPAVLLHVPLSFATKAVAAKYPVALAFSLRSPLPSCPCLSLSSLPSAFAFLVAFDLLALSKHRQVHRYVFCRGNVCLGPTDSS